jgi:hypothetical protein
LNAREFHEYSGEEVGKIGIHTGGKQDSCLGEAAAQFAFAIGQDVFDSDGKVNVITDADNGLYHFPALSWKNVTFFDWNFF